MSSWYWGMYWFVPPGVARVGRGSAALMMCSAAFSLFARCAA